MYPPTNLDASNFVEGVDRAFMIILGFSFLFIFVLTFLMILFIIKYRKSKHPKAVQIKGNTKLEIAWSAGALVLVLVLFYFGWAGWKPMMNPPDDAMHVKAIARMWQFQFVYENGKVTDTLYLPVNESVILDLVALDVIHSLYIPAFRVKEDMVPGLKKDMWFRPQRVGEYDLFCAEYCGLNHSYMYTGVNILSAEDFETWYKDSTVAAPPKDQPAWQAGLDVLRKNGCNVCHSSDGSKLIGPSYLGIYGSSREVKTGNTDREVLADSLYIRNSIYTPDADVAKGFNKGLMLSYEGLVTEEEVGLIIEYLKHLNER
ncbi:cytochrome c oxidase subunit II [Bacteroidota bacterium]